MRISLRSDKLASDNRPGSAIRQHAKGRSGEYGKRLDDEEELEEDEKEQQFNNTKGMMLIWGLRRNGGAYSTCAICRTETHQIAPLRFLRVMSRPVVAASVRLRTLAMSATCAPADFISNSR